MTAIFLMMNNYFHDFATAFLGANLILLLALTRGLTGKLALNRDQLAVVFGVATRVSIITLVWISVGGAIRSLNYSTFEWVEAAGKGQVVALGIKHAIMGGITVAGLGYQVVLTLRFKKTGTWEKNGMKKVRETA